MFNMKVFYVLAVMALISACGFTQQINFTSTPQTAPGVSVASSIPMPPSDVNVTQSLRGIRTIEDSQFNPSNESGVKVRA